MTAAAKLEASLERAARQPRRRGVGYLAHTPYRDRSWRAQRQLHRSDSRFRVLVAGRGVGKTHGAAYELLQIVLEAPTGSEGAVLAPTLTHAEAAISKLREVAAPLPGVSWVQSKRRLYLPGGRSIKVFSADRKETVRGPSLVALWVDEGAYISAQAIEASLPALRSVGVETKLLITTTPAGKNWVFGWWESDAEDVERFRFRATDSPFQDAAVIQLARSTMSPEKFAQEYLAEFVDNLLLVFPDREGLFVESLPRREKGGRWMGVDLGKKDYVVCTLLNEWCEGFVAGRWNEDTPGFQAATYWAQTHERVAALCLEHGATAVVDTGGAGGAPGAVLAEHLRSKGIEVVEVKTSSQGTKAKIVELAKADVQWRKLRLLQNEHSGALDYEMSKFQGIKRVHHGQELTIYEGPQVEGEHDDCVISFCLANWGRVMDETPEDPGDGGIGSFARAALSPGGSSRSAPRGGGGYLLR